MHSFIPNLRTLFTVLASTTLAVALCPIVLADPSDISLNHASIAPEQPSQSPLVQPDAMAQVTSVSQLSDVQPTDWAFQALQSLVERYGCIVGYPDSTFRGQRALTRFEFTAGLNACLDRITEVLSTATANAATREDLATLERLQQEFAAELATLRNRVDVLEARVSEIEANQFSTTTKLTGEVVLGLADVFGGIEETNNTILGTRARLIFETSFTGEDLLTARLQAGNFGRFETTNDADKMVLGNEARLGFDTDTDGAFDIDILSYQFPMGDRITAFAIAQIDNYYDSDLVDVISPFASSGSGAISRFGRFNPIYRLGSGAGAGVSLELNDAVALQVGYLAAEAYRTSGGAGLFNGDYAALGQLMFTPFDDRLSLGLTYINSYAGLDDEGEAVGFDTGTGSERSVVAVGRPVSINSYGVEANFQITEGIEIGGWAGFSAVRVLGQGDADVWNYALTLGFPDLGGDGNLGGLVVGIQPRLTGTSGLLVEGRRRDSDTGLHLEAFYRYQLNDNISVTPGILWLTAPNHDNDNEDVVLGTIRTTFSF